MACKYKEKTLSLLKGEIEDNDLEEHIEVCTECAALVEGYLEKSKEIEVHIDDELFLVDKNKFKKYIYKYRKGMARIIVFTLIGMFMGWMSFRYVSDSFFVTKLITAIPYKISEIIYGFLYKPPYLYLEDYNAFFPQVLVVSFMAERLTPVLIGGALYGSLGYFTGSRKIFTLKKYIRFICIWCSIILAWIGSMFVLNEYFLIRNNQLKDISGFFLNAKMHGSGYYEDHRNEIYQLLRNALGNIEELKTLSAEEIKRSEHETRVEIFMGVSRRNKTIVNWEEKFMILEDGRAVAISDEFAALVRDYYYEQGIFEKEANYRETKIESIEVLEEGGDK